jgi:hypothetical protein
MAAISAEKTHLMAILFGVYEAQFVLFSATVGNAPTLVTNSEQLRMATRPYLILKFINCLEAPADNFVISAATRSGLQDEIYSSDCSGI